MKMLWGLDPLGFMTFVPSILCLLLGHGVGFNLKVNLDHCFVAGISHWSGTTYAWQSGSLFVVFQVALIAFNAYWLRESATSQ